MGLRDEIMNSTAALSQHLRGNLTYFIGFAIAKTANVEIVILNFLIHF